MTPSGKRRVSSAILAVILIAGPLAWLLAPGDSGGIRFSFVIVDAEGVGVAPSSSLPVAVYASVWILEPPPGGWRLVYKGWVDGNVIVPAWKIADVAWKWLEYEADRLSVGGGFHEPALRPVKVTVHVVAKNGSVLLREVFFYTFNPMDVINGGVLDIPLRLRVDASLAELRERIGVAEWFPCEEYVWRLEWRVTAEHIVGNYTGIPYQAVNSAGSTVYYVALPLLIVYNDDFGNNGPSLDGELSGWLMLEGSFRASLQATVGIGLDVAYKIYSGDWTGGLSGSLLQAGPSYEDRLYVNPPHFSGVSSGEAAVLYIYARPVVEFYREYVVESELCGPGREWPTGWERIDVYIEDIYIYYVDPSTGDKYADTGIYVGRGMPDWLAYVEEMLGVSLEAQRLYIPSTPLSDGALNPGEWVSPSTIISYLDSESMGACESFDAALPAGVVLSLALAASSRASFAPLVSALSVGVELGGSAEGASEIQGRIENNGLVSEYIYVGLSGLEYRRDPPWWCLWCDPCYFKIPIAYIEGR